MSKKRYQIFKQPSVSIDKCLVIVEDGDDLLSVEEVVDVLNKQSDRIMLLEDNLLAMNMTNGNLEGALECMEKEIEELKKELDCIKKTNKLYGYNVECDYEWYEESDKDE